MSNGAARDGRSAILGNIKRALADGAALHGATPLAERQRTVNERIAGHKRNLIPSRVDKSKPDLTTMFASYLGGQSATVKRVDSLDDVPTAIAAYLRDNNLPARLRMGDDPQLAKLPWQREPNLAREHGPARDDDTVSVSRAIAGVAETGTLMLGSGADNPVTLNFMPANHIVVIDESDIAGPYEDAWARVRELYGERVMPRTINMISGPSRTGDIGGILVRGAHGPKDMCVIIVNSAEKEGETKA